MSSGANNDIQQNLVDGRCSTHKIALSTISHFVIKMDGCYKMRDVMYNKPLIVKAISLYW